MFRKAFLAFISTSYIFVSILPGQAAAQDAGALMGGLAGGMIGGMIAGSMARQNSGQYYTRRSYSRSYSRSHASHARAPAQSQPGHASAAINASDPFAKSSNAPTTSVGSR